MSRYWEELRGHDLKSDHNNEKLREELCPLAVLNKESKDKERHET